MKTLTAQQKGGKVMAERQRREALDRYYKNPSICQNCDKVIEVTGKVHEARRKFCCRSCAAIYNNKLFVKRSKSYKYKTCTNCEERANSRSGLCLRCYHESLNDNAGKITKGELFDKRSGYQSARSSIRHHANVSYRRSGKPYVCSVCGYSTHVEICHIHSVSQYPDSATLAEINHPDNLIALCPNHHWEHDNLSSENRI